MQVTQKDIRPLERFAAAVGIGKIYGPYESQADKHRYSVTGTAAHTLLERLHPYLSEPKREQAARVLAEIEEHYVTAA